MTVIADKADNPYSKPDACRTCPLYLAEGPVWGEGPSTAKMMFVGEAPGEEEARSLRPFIGGSGRVLNAQLNQCGIARSQVFITNTVKCRPTAVGARGERVNRQPTETEIRCCARFLLRDLQTVQPNVIVALGNIPLHTLTDAKKGITLLRSVPLEGPKRDAEGNRYKVIGTLHPAAVMRSQDYWPAVIFDLVRARTESAFSSIIRRPWKRVVHARLSDVGTALERRIRTPRLGGLRYYHHDLETTGLDPHTSTFRCVGLAAEPDEVYCFDWTHDVIEFIRTLHADEDLLTVGQNSEGFDIPFQEAKGFVFNGPSYDTMIGWHLLNSSLPKDLGFIGATVTDEPYWKDDSMYRAGEDALQHGCAKDVHATARAFEEQYKELEQLGQTDLYFKHIMPLQPVLRSMTKRGVKKDQRAALGWHTILNRKADEFEDRLKKGLSDASFDVNSPKQLMELLYTRMKLPVQYNQDRAKGLRPTVDADALDNLARVSNNPILKLIRSIRTLRKWDATFIMCEHDEQGFVHGKFSSAKAANGRLNSYDPNMQNFPVDARVIMVPDTDDHVFVARDWSQIEWRVAMGLSGDRAGLDALAAGRDAHKDAYSQAFVKEYAEVTKAERDIAKAVNYGLLYGRGAESVAQGRSGHPEDLIPIDRVRSYMNAFLARFSGYGEFRKQIERQVRKQHYVSTPWGRRRWWYTTSSMPEAFNFPISGTAAHMMYEAIVEVDAQLPPGASLRLTVHDELVACSPKDQKTLQMTIDCMRDVMERPFPLLTTGSLFPDVVRHYYPSGWFCPSDCHIGSTWRMTKGAHAEDVAAEAEMIKHLGVHT